MGKRLRKQVFRALQSAAMTYLPLILMELARRGLERRRTKNDTASIHDRGNGAGTSRRRHKRTAPRSTTEAINRHVTDMLALEQHIEVAIRAQVADFQDEPRVLVETLEQAHARVQKHVEALKDLTDMRGAGTGNSMAEALKRAGSILAGFGAAAVDVVRSEKLPRDLRDDYTAFSLATVSYVMLLSTAKALDDEEVAELAERHMKEYTKVVMTLNNILPSAVIAELREDGLPADEAQLPAIADALHGAWRDPYGEVPDIDEVSAG